MKRTFAFALALVLSASLIGCGKGEPAPTTAAPETEASAVTETTVPVATETLAVPTGESYDPAAMAAFRAALKQIRDDHIWPCFEAQSEIQLFEGGSFDDEQFAICDVDGDGEKELIAAIANTYMAGMCEAVYAYDPASGGVRLESQGFPPCEYYPGLLKDLASHNHGYAGEVLWPYSISVYDAASDSYVYQYYVDAWDKTISDTYYDETPYPSDIDVNNDGFVYLITDKDGNVKTLNKADFESWEQEIFGGKQQITIPWQKMTAENVNNVG